MSNEDTITIGETYTQEPRATLFLTKMFKPKFFDTEFIEFDIKRSGRAVSVAIQDLSVGNRIVEATTFTNKRFVPAIHGEEFAVNSWDLLKRQFGADPFQSTEFRSALIIQILETARLVEGNIGRSNEWQASQALQTGIIILTDSSGKQMFKIDFKPKAPHFFTSPVTWDTATKDQMFGDIIQAGDVNLKDGVVASNQLIFGEAAWLRFSGQPDILELLNKLNVSVGSFVHEDRGEGATFKGMLAIGNNNYELWTYSGLFDDPQTGLATPFVTTDSCIVRNKEARMDAVFGGIPHAGRLLGRQPLLIELPQEVRNADAVMGLHFNSWLSTDGYQVLASVKSRPTFIPIAIDTFANISTQAT